MGSPTRIPMAAPVLGGNELAYVSEAVRSGWISSQGAFVPRFEEGFAAFCGARHGVAVNSGTTALHLALVAAGVGPGDEVILPTLTMIASINSVVLTGATPVLVDAEPATWNCDPAAIERTISPRTKVIMPVHTYGHPAEMGPITKAAARHGLLVVEDAAEAHGAEYEGRRVGSLGHLGCFSFYANKIITTGEGGMVVTSDAGLAARARRLRDHGFIPGKRFWHEEQGFSYRLTNVQAAIGLAQLEQIDAFVEARRRNARLYASLLEGVDGITLPPEAAWARSVFWMFSLLVSDHYPGGRDAVAERLQAHGIETRTFFYPMHVQPLYRARFAGQAFPVATELARTGLNLPSGNGLTREEIEEICALIRLRGRPRGR